MNKNENKSAGKFLFFFLIILIVFVFTISCKERAPKIEKRIENGVEVVVNHLEPYVIPDEPSTLTLEKLFSIDTEDDSTAEIGLTDIYRFDIDENGNIFILRPPAGTGDLIYTFSENGEFITSFGVLGQGPHEMEYPNEIIAVPDQGIWIIEDPKQKYHVFDEQGHAVEEKKISSGFESLYPLENGMFLMKRLIVGDMSSPYFTLSMGLYDKDFHIMRELDEFKKVPNKNKAALIQEKIVNGIEYIFLSEEEGGRIYLGNSERSYEISVFDLEGTLLHKIQKEYSPVPVSSEYKENYLKPFKKFMPDYAKKIYFPECWHAFHSFFLDDQGRLYVMTYEPGENPGEHMYDIFNEDGVFIARMSLNASYQNYGRLLARSRSERIYCVQEKESGYRQLSVYKMTWGK